VKREGGGKQKKNTKLLGSRSDKADTGSERKGQMGRWGEGERKGKSTSRSIKGGRTFGGEAIGRLKERSLSSIGKGTFGP